LTPESRIEMLEERRAFVERNEDTHDASEFAIMGLLLWPANSAQLMD
jgi:hypothetical protein